MKNEFINRFKSSVKIRIKGKNIERFIKKTMNLKIELLDIKIIKYNEAIIKIYKKDLNKINDIKTIYEIKVIEVMGLAKIKKILNFNKYLIISIMIGYILLLILTNMIFEIDIVHNKKSLRKLLKSELEEYGLKEKRFKKSYKEIQQIKKEILEKHKNKIEWLEIEEQGTKYIVRVEERILNKKSKQIKKQDIVAKKAAILKRIDAETGEIVKDVNEYVKKGEIVITGNIKLNEQTKSLVGASGKIYGEVWYKTIVEYPLHYKEKILTGDRKKVIALKFIDKDFSLEFKKYRSKKIKEQTLLKNNLLPIKLVSQEQIKTKVINEKLNEKEAIKKATKKAIMKIKSKLSDNEYIIDYKRLKVEKNNSKIVLELFFTVCEDITDTKELTQEDLSDELEE